MQKKRKIITHLYLAVTSDEYELPVAVADTTKELAAMTGRNHKSIKSCISRGFNGKSTGIKFLKVAV
jgi:hypothetical protein